MHFSIDRTVHTTAASRERERNVLFNDALNTFYIGQLGVLLERGSQLGVAPRHEHHIIYGYMALDIWLRTILIVRKETRYRHIGYSYRLQKMFIK